MFKTKLQKARQVIEERQAIQETAKLAVQAKRNQETQVLVNRIREVAASLGIHEWVVYRHGVDYGVLFGYKVFYDEGVVKCVYSYNGDHYRHEAKPLTADHLADRIAGYGHGGETSVDYDPRAETIACGYTE